MQAIPDMSTIPTIGQVLAAVGINTDDFQLSISAKGVVFGISKTYPLQLGDPFTGAQPLVSVTELHACQGLDEKEPGHQRVCRTCTCVLSLPSVQPAPVMVRQSCRAQGL